MTRCIAVVVMLALPACTSEGLYGAGEGWRQNQCNRIVDKAERDRCMEAASREYRDYARERERIAPR